MRTVVNPASRMRLKSLALIATPPCAVSPCASSWLPMLMHAPTGSERGASAAGAVEVSASVAAAASKIDSFIPVSPEPSPSRRIESEDERVVRRDGALQRRGGGARALPAPHVGQAEAGLLEIRLPALEPIAEIGGRPVDPRGSRLVAAIEQRDRPASVG